MSVLNQVITGKKIKPICIIFYGLRGIGKTTFPSESTAPIYVGPEENDEIDCPRLPKVTSWDQFKDQLKSLRDEKHNYKTLVIDTMDMLEQVAQKKILTGPNAVKNMETAMGGYGKAYKQMADMFLEIRDNYLVPIRDKRGMNIVILCHAEKNKHEDPMTNTSYDTYSTAMHKKIKPIFEDWVSGIFFANYILLRAERNDGKEYVEGMDGKREIYTEERPSHTGKNRFDLPFEMEFPKVGAWKLFTDHVRSYYGNAAKAAPSTAKIDEDRIPTTTTVESIQSEPEDAPGAEVVGGEVAQETPGKSYKELAQAIDDLFGQMPESSRGGITTAIKRAGADTKELERILTKMQGALK